MLPSFAQRRIGALGRTLVAGLAFIGLACAAGGAPASAEPWLFVSDIHFDPTARGGAPATFGADTNAPLLASTIAAMRRAAPHPPVIVISGDFLGHQFDPARAASTMRALARAFDRAFPQTQFVIALGNEDSACGDYALAPNSAFLTAVASAWAPLVNRRGAAPAFRRTFVRDGFYTTRLPLARTRAIVIDDVFWSPRYHAGCGPAAGGAAEMTAELRAALREPNERRWIVAHIPPGIDAYSTAHLAHRLVVVPFLDAAPRESFLALVREPAAQVELVIAAHTHKFAYRILGGAAGAIPLLLVPSVSPIFNNAPAFLSVEVDPSGTIRRADDHAFLHGRWRDIGGTRSLGLEAFTGEELQRLQRRLARSAQLRVTFARLYNSGAPPEIDERNWRTYWCAATAFSATTLRGCLSEPGVSVFTARGLAAIAIVLLGVLAAGVALVRRSRRGGPRARPLP